MQSKQKVLALQVAPVIVDRHPRVYTAVIGVSMRHHGWWNPTHVSRNPGIRGRGVFARYLPRHGNKLGWWWSRLHSLVLIRALLILVVDTPPDAIEKELSESSSVLRLGLILLESNKLRLDGLGTTAAFLQVIVDVAIGVGQT